MILFGSARGPACGWRPAFRAAVARPGATVFPVLTITLPDGSAVRYASAETPSLSSGPYTGRVLRWGAVDLGVALRDGRLGSVDMSIEIDDVDRSWAAIEARFSRRLRGSAAVVNLLVAGVAATDCPAVFSGVLHNWPPGELRYTLELRPPDGVLRNGRVPQPLISLGDYPRASQDALEKPFPVVYGTFDSTGAARRGLVPTYRVDGQNAVYLVCLGRAAVRGVYNAGVVVQASEYSLNYRRGAKTVTEVDFTTDPGESTEITVDVDGLTAFGDGTGTVITNPVDQMAHFLHNFVWGNWLVGPWLTTTAPLDPRSWNVASRKVARRGYSGAHYFGGERRVPRDLLDEWAASTGLLTWWTADGLLAVGLLDPLEERIYLDAPRVEGRDVGEFERPLAADQLARRVVGGYVQDPAGGGYLQTSVVMDHTLTERVELQRDMPWTTS